MKIGFVFTDDWELFGDGSGNFEQLQIAPGYMFMHICEKYGVKYTFMAEVGQYWGFQRHAHCSPPLSQSAQLWEQFLKDAIRRGHDVQLHLHPQWDGAQYHRGQWYLNDQKYALAKLPADEIEQLLRRGKKCLESLLMPIRANYRCICFRAGGWAVQPSYPLLSCMAQAGLYCDSSIVRGKTLTSRLVQYDFSSAFSGLFSWWTDPNDINLAVERAKSHVLEIPIYAQMGYDTSYFQTIPKWQRATRLLSNKYPLHRHPVTPEEVTNRKKQPVLFDHGFLSTDHMLDYTHRILKRIADDDIESIVPVITLTHSKYVTFFEEFERFLATITDKYNDKICFMSLYEAWEYLTDDI